MTSCSLFDLSQYSPRIGTNKHHAVGMIGLVILQGTGQCSANGLRHIHFFVQFIIELHQRWNIDRNENDGGTAK